MKSIVGLILIFIAMYNAFGQKVELPIYNQDLKIKPTFTLNNDFNLDDWYTGFSGGIEDQGYQWGARMGFQLRPFRKKIEVIESSNILRQYHERKFLIFLDVDKRLGHLLLFNKHFQFFLGARTGFLMGNYSGTKNDAENHWVIAPVGGICFNFNDNSFIKIGYNHFTDYLRNVDDGRISLSFIFNLKP